MSKHKVLFVTQEIFPYMDDSHMSRICRYLPQGIQEKGKEIRTFMPRYGCVNERRNQLHEVIRLSGMNLIIDDMDHPLIIKVASIQSARLQIYFIDNEDYFQRKHVFADGSCRYFADNDERAIFYARGVLETVKKLGWSPSIIHCHGWFSSLVPLYVKRAFKDNPVFTDTKVIISVYNDEIPQQFSSDFVRKIKYDGISDKDLRHYKDAGWLSVMKGAIDFSDAVIAGDKEINSDLATYIKKSGKPFLEYQNEENYVEAFDEFYDEILVDEEVLM
jgi:starch synthase